ncbi:MAG: hypothetical protein K8H88_04560 [Sandaracinaceae bacterium]|nr:hypothetical protein [Sandaracinaceae bacterium]
MSDWVQSLARSIPYVVLGGVGGLIAIVSFIGVLFVLVQAARKHWLHALASIFVPGYLFYFAAVELERTKKNKILIGAIVAGFTLLLLGMPIYEERKRAREVAELEQTGDDAVHDTAP